MSYRWKNRHPLLIWNADKALCPFMSLPKVCGSTILSSPWYRKERVCLFSMAEMNTSSPTLPNTPAVAARTVNHVLKPLSRQDCFSGLPVYWLTEPYASGSRVKADPRDSIGMRHHMSRRRAKQPSRRALAVGFGRLTWSGKSILRAGNARTATCKSQSASAHRDVPFLWCGHPPIHWPPAHRTRPPGEFRCPLPAG